VYWIFAVLVVVAAKLIQGLGILLPTNIRIYFELRMGEPDMPKIQKLMRRYVKIVAMLAVNKYNEIINNYRVLKKGAVGFKASSFVRYVFNV
jgi:hypothetical protein